MPYYSWVEQRRGPRDHLLHGVECFGNNRVGHSHSQQAREVALHQARTEVGRRLIFFHVPTPIGAGRQLPWQRNDLPQALLETSR